jgi:hypothetical protein
LADEEVPMVHMGLTAQAERGIDLHVLYAAVLPSFFVRTRTDQIAYRDPTKTDSNISATIFRLLQVTSIVLTEAADPCLIPADFFVVNAGQGPWQRMGRKRFTAARG